MGDDGARALSAAAAGDTAELRNSAFFFKFFNNIISNYCIKIIAT